MRDREWTFARALAFLLGFVLLTAQAQAAGHVAPPLMERLTPDVMAVVYPEGAERLGEPTGSPAAVPVYKGDDVVAYIFSTLDVVAAPGYSGTPFDVIAGVDLNGVITGAKVIYHHEAYIERDPERQVLIAEFLARLAGTTRNDSGTKVLRPDFVAGATVSARAMRAAVYDAARLVLRAHGGRPIVTEPTLDVEGFQPLDGPRLLADGYVTGVDVTTAEAAQHLADAGITTPDTKLPADPQKDYVRFYTALATPALVGRNLLGANRYQTHFDSKPPPLAVFVATSGPYDFLGISYLRKSTGYFMDRIRLVQGDKTVTFTKADFTRLTASGIPIPNLTHAGLLTLPEQSGFDPLKPWRVELLINGTKADGGPASTVIPLAYEQPAATILLPEPEPPPVWLEAWLDARVNLAILGAMLVVLTLIMTFQGRLTRHRRLHRYIRNGFLLFTLIWLGWTASAQLSTIHVLNYALAPFRHYDLAFYLAEPLILVLAFYTLGAVLLIGRGVFCGWLCPFGALQELLAQVARFLKLPQWNPSERLQRNAWLGKYIAATVVVFVAFTWPEMESTAAEVEPFKTAITSMFTRPWPFVVYAVLLLTAGLFTERAYCRFLCPLGGVLALLDRLHLLTLLKRRPECGHPCHLCESSCPVRAIERSGKIQMAECFQCLDCQVEYQDDHRCPPLAKQRKQRERAIAAAAAPVRVPVTVRAVGKPA